MYKSHNITDHLKDIINYMETAEHFVENMEYQRFQEDTKTIFAIIRALEVIGEAVKHIPTDFRKQYPQIPWQDIAGMRDVLIHDYLEIDTTTLWNTMTKNIPTTKPLLKQILNDLLQQDKN
jgi:uncharacterized protein with HEPN domain